MALAAGAQGSGHGDSYRPESPNPEPRTLHPAQPEQLILYDGVCGFCHRAVRWVLRADRAGRFRFAPLQGRTAEELRRRHPELPRALDSIVYVRRVGGEERLFRGAEAMFRICGELPGAWRLVARLRWLPRSWTEGAYRVFARHRYRWFGRFDTCLLPSPAERARFLD
jgi:predicted DCC family thiol-disulfide oxidoreductase YuxK